MIQFLLTLAIRIVITAWVADLLFSHGLPILAWIWIVLSVLEGFVKLGAQAGEAMRPRS